MKQIFFSLLIHSWLCAEHIWFTHEISAVNENFHWLKITICSMIIHSGRNQRRVTQNSVQAGYEPYSRLVHNSSSTCRIQYIWHAWNERRSREQYISASEWTLIEMCIIRQFGVSTSFVARCHPMQKLIKIVLGYSKVISRFEYSDLCYQFSSCHGFW